MMPYCLIFPGQGTQFVGMARTLEVTDSVGRELLDLMETGPEEVLGQTLYAQQAIFAVTAALWARSGLDQPEMVMGHSLGEYMALVAAGALSLSDALPLVQHRAAFMEGAGREGEGGMAAVLGLSVEDVSEVVDAFDDVWVANINQARQVVIAGSARSLRDAQPMLREKGAKRVVPLKISVASHCPYMESAKEALREYLHGVTVRKPRARVVFNATAREESEPDRIKTLLADQLVSPVRWEESVRYAAGVGIRRFVEIGPKSVLAPLVRKIIPDAEVEVVAAHEH